jgi:hypothetical protein
MASIEKALKIALKALANNAAESPGCNRNHAAVTELYNQRNDPNTPSDENVALAEHYLLARAQMSCGLVSETQMKGQVLGYYAMKYNLEKANALQGVRHNANKPVTPPSYKQVLIGLAGVEHGTQDKKKYPPGDKAPIYQDLPKFVGARK